MHKVVYMTSYKLLSVSKIIKDVGKHFLALEHTTAAPSYYFLILCCQFICKSHKVSIALLIFRSRLPLTLKLPLPPSAHSLKLKPHHA